MAKVINKVYWKDGYHSRVSAEVAYAEIERIRKRNGGNVLPEVVLAEASKKRNPLHSVFDWDDSEAGKKWRVHQARNMINKLVIVRKESPKHPVRVYEIERMPAVKDEPSRNVYRTTEDILKDPMARGELLQRALRDLMQCARKYRTLQELSIVFREIDAVYEKFNADEVAEKAAS